MLVDPISTTERKLQITLQLVVVVLNAHTTQILPPYTEIHKVTRKSQPSTPRFREILTYTVNTNTQRQK